MWAVRHSDADPLRIGEVFQVLLQAVGDAMLPAAVEQDQDRTCEHNAQLPIAMRALRATIPAP